MRFPSRRREEELDEEIQAHLRMAIEDRMGRGETAEQARDSALREFGNVGLVKEVTRDVWGWRPAGELAQDLRYGARMLVKSRGFTFIAVITLALGIGATTAIFSVVNTVLLKPLPFKESDRLVIVWEEGTAQGFPRNSVSAANYIDWRDQNQVFEGMSILGRMNFNLTGVGEPERIDGRRVSANLFDLLGVKLRLGRAFLPEEDQPGSNRVVILSHGLWQRRFGSDANIIGQPLTLNGQSFTVVGVMPPQFQFPSPQDELWVPIAFTSQEAANRGNNSYEVIARMKPGVMPEQAQAEMNTIAARLKQQYPDVVKSNGSVVIPLHEQLMGDIKPALLVLLGAVGFVLLIACANVANLLLARAAVRQKEIAVRIALGAGRLRLIRQFLIESVLLAALGGAGGLLLALWGVSLLKAFIPENLPQVQAITVDASVLIFTLLISLLTGLIFGLAPALQSSKVNLNETLKEGGRDSASGSHGNRIRGLLVIAEVAVSLVLLIGAGLFINSFVRLLNVDAGFRADNLLTINVVLPEMKYPDQARRTAFYSDLLSRIEALPGVQSAAVTNYIPLTLQGDTFGISIEGRPDPGPAERPDVVTRVISPKYFSTMGIELLQGREFGEEDRVDSPRVAVISETMARRLWPGEDPVGKRIKPGPPDSPVPWRTIIGVVKDVRQFELNANPKLQMYYCYVQPAFFVPSYLVVRTDVEPASLAAAVRGAVWEIDKDQPVSNIRTMKEVLSESIARQRFSMLLLGIFAAVALVLAAVGIYGVMSYSAAQRTREIGIRMALGAQSRDVLRLAIGQGMKMALVGVAVGLTGAFALTRLIESLLFGVSTTDPATFALVTFLLIAAALLACYIPARRATRVDPLVALRYE
ncbi:MAG TPA: ABC transporter permease [Blastocatellia bacterium]|nr:ABC transporter permease [Blastocatellia bacterium]